MLLMGEPFSHSLLRVICTFGFLNYAVHDILVFKFVDVVIFDLNFVNVKII